MHATEQLAAGRDALRRGAWEEARAAFAAALADRESAEALEGYGLAAWWLDDATATFEARERAYALYAEQGDALGAARIATLLAWDAQAFRGEAAVAQGWLARARRLLEGHERTAEYGWLVAREGEMALHRGADPETARRLGAEAAALGHELGDVDLEMVGRALEGLAAVGIGDVAEGMRLLDETAAAATGGEMHDLTAIGLACCRVIFACEHVRDYDRAAQWAQRLSEFCVRWGLRPLFAICRASYAGVLLERGRWRDAEDELVRAQRQLEETRPPQVGSAIARLGELRRRQGRREEAGKLFDEVPGSMRAAVGRARLALDRRDAESAVELADAALRRVPAAYITERVDALSALVESLVAAGRAQDAEAPVAELRAIAETVATEPLRATAAWAGGLATGDRDLLEEAVDRFTNAGLPYEAAHARLALASVLGATERAARERETAERTLRDLGAPARPRELLSSREQEVLRLVATGLTDGEIASRLVLSEHTVHRHVANIRQKLGAGSRAAAVSAAMKLGLL
jgi:LuxR family transcriptional regulator, maltose regulon positive regulatory protein